MLHCTSLKKGMGPPVVFLHGFLGTSFDWLEVCSHLPSWRCFGIDLPGHGASPFTPNFIEEMPLFEEPIHLIGYSMGGRLAMEYAARFPSKIQTLSLISTHPGLKTEGEREKRRLVDLEWSQKLFTSKVDAFLLDWYDQPLFGPFRPDMTIRRMQNPAHLAQCLTHYSLGNRPLVSPKIDLVIVGERDEKYRELWPRGEIIRDTHHMVHLEKPDLLAQMIEKRLS